MTIIFSSPDKNLQTAKLSVSRKFVIIHHKLVNEVYVFLCAVDDKHYAIAQADIKGNVSSRSGTKYNIGQEWSKLQSQ